MTNLILTLSILLVLYGIILIILTLSIVKYDRQFHLFILAFLTFTMFSLWFLYSAVGTIAHGSDAPEKYQPPQLQDIRVENSDSVQAEARDTVIVTGKDISVMVKSHAGFDLIY